MNADERRPRGRRAAAAAKTGEQVQGDRLRLRCPCVPQSQIGIRNSAIPGVRPSPPSRHPIAPPANLRRERTACLTPSREAAKKRYFVRLHLPSFAA
jgi:hypothetical protein